MVEENSMKKLNALFLIVHMKHYLEEIESSRLHRYFNMHEVIT